MFENAVINNRMTAADHVSKLLETCARRLYVLRVLRHHGVSSIPMNDVFRMTVLAKLLYRVSSWSGFCSAVDRDRLDAFIRRCKRLYTTVTTTYQRWQKCLRMPIALCSAELYLYEMTNTCYSTICQISVKCSIT